jgi:hypothetical protein
MHRSCSQAKKNRRAVAKRFSYPVRKQVPLKSVLASASALSELEPLLFEGLWFRVRALFLVVFEWIEGNRLVRFGPVILNVL